MVYHISGALSGIPIVTRSTMNVIMIQPSSRIVQATATSQNYNERSPLIPRNRRIRTRSERILNWKIVSLFLLLVLGVFIGIYLLIVECKIKKYKVRLRNYNDGI